MNRETSKIEHAMAESDDRMGRASGHGVNRHHVDMATKLQDEASKASAKTDLSEHFFRNEPVTKNKMIGDVKRLGTFTPMMSARTIWK